MATNSQTLHGVSQPNASRSAFSGETTRSVSGLEVDNREHESGLEVDGRPQFSDDPELVRNHYSDLEVAPSHGQIESLTHQNLQAYHPDVPNDGDSRGLIPYHPGVNRDVEAPIFDEKNPTSSVTVAEAPKRTCGLRPRTFWILLAVILVVIVAAAVGGGVGGSLGYTRRLMNGSSNSNDNSSSGSNSTSSSAPNSTSTQDPKNGIRTDSSLAAVAWRGSNSQYQYRVYYQGDENALKESAYDSTTGSWRVSVLVKGSQVADATPITATSSKNSSDGVSTRLLSCCLS